MRILRLMPDPQVPQWQTSPFGGVLLELPCLPVYLHQDIGLAPVSGRSPPLLHNRMEFQHRKCLSGGAVLKEPDFVFVKDRPEGPPNANCQLPPTARFFFVKDRPEGPPTATNCQPATATNCCQPPAATNRQPCLHAVAGLRKCFLWPDSW